MQPVHIQCQYLIPALNAWASRAEFVSTRLIPTHLSYHGCMGDLTIERSFDSQSTWVIDVFGLFLDMLFMGICTTRH